MRVLISGAGPAGLATARQLALHGHDITVVERSPQLRLTGTPIDIRGEALSAVDKMGLLGEIRAHRVRMSESTHFVDAEGNPLAPLPLARINDSPDDVELLRGDLVRILFDALPDPGVVQFGDWIEELTDDGAGVDVRLSSGRTGRHDLVLGADGLHSAVRGLVFGPEREFLRHLGVYFALADHPGGDTRGAARSPGGNSIHNVPGRMAGLFRYEGRTVAVFQFRSEQPGYDRLDQAAQKQLLTDVFADQLSWRIPELLTAAQADPGFYFTSASQIHMPSWHHGRIALLGDAAHSPAHLSGRGTSLALTGALHLTEELQLADHTTAFERYETRQRPSVTAAQARAHEGRDHLLPPTWEAIATRNEGLRELAARVGGGRGR